MIPLFALLSACQDSIPTVTSLTSATSKVAAKDASNFVQLSAASQKATTAGGYNGTIRISQPLGRLQATTAAGHTLQGTVTFQR